MSKQKYGEAHHRAKVSNEDVELMRQLKEAGVTGAEIARKFEVNYNTVMSILNYRSRAYA